MNKAQKILHTAVVFTLVFLCTYGLAMCLFEIKPFWVDEWRIIYNLKFKTVTELWGPLDFMQQFPRTYLSLLKAITQHFQYSYTSLRTPPFIPAVASILLCYRLMQRLYPANNLLQYFFVMVFVSYCTFTDYFVQIKQYSMDMMLCLVALWQLLAMHQLTVNKASSKFSYFMLCFSFLLAPFFSYSYPVAAMPIYLVIPVAALALRKKVPTQFSAKQILVVATPLFIGLLGVSISYVVDVSQLLHDKEMNNFWGHLMMRNGFRITDYLEHFFHLFAQVGAGLLFWWIFGILGTFAFAYGIYTYVFKSRYEHLLLPLSVAHIYALLLIISIMLLSAVGKLPMGEPRLNAFAIPSIALLLIHLLQHLWDTPKTKKMAVGVATLLYISVIGNIYTTALATFNVADYAKKMDIYKATNKAISLAQQKNLPILISPEVAFPYDKTVNLPFTNTVPGDWVLKTFPAYDPVLQLNVWGIPSIDSLQAYMQLLPPTIKTIMAGDGLRYSIQAR